MKAHVLVVDDEDALREILRDNLEAEGYRVSEAADGPPGLELALAERPDLILMDVMMPSMDGLETTRGHFDRLFEDNAAAIVRPDRIVFGHTTESTTLDALIGALAQKLHLT